MHRVRLLAALGLAVLASCTSTTVEAPEHEAEPSLSRQRAALETYTATVAWNGASVCTTCGSTQYACSDGTGNWNNGVRTFVDPVPAGGQVVGVTVAVYGRGWDGGTAQVFLNGTALGAYTPPAYSFFEKLASCNTCDDAQLVQYAVGGGVTSLPGYKYGGTNSLQLVTNATNCVARAVLTLTVVRPQANVSARFLDFGAQQVGATLTQTLNVTNSGSSALVLKSATASPPFSVVSGTFPATVQPGARLPLAVQFHPTTEGTFSNVLTLETNDAANASIRIALQGTGGESALKVSPLHLDFAPQALGTFSTQDLVLRNPGSFPLTIQSLSSEAPFSTSGVPPPPFTIAAGGSQVVRVTFSPTAAMPFTGELLILSNDSHLPVAHIPLSGAGARPTISVRPAGLDFHFQGIGTSSQQHVVVSNEGLQELVVDPIEFPAPYLVQAPESPLRLAPGERATLDVTFQPTAAGAFNGKLTLKSNDSSSPSVTVNLAGTGVGATLDASETQLAFAPQHVATTSPGKTVKLTNTGPAPLVLHAAELTGPFAVLPDSRLVLSPGTSVDLTVTFTPTAATSYQGKLTLTADGPGAEVVTVTLTGQGESPKIEVDPHSRTFTSQKVGTTSASQPVTVRNLGNEAASIQTYAVEGPFTVSGLNQPEPLAAAGQPTSARTFSITFTPTQANEVTGRLLMYSTASASPLVVRLQGTGVQTAASVLPVAVDFGGQRVGTTSAPRTVTLTNTGNATLNLSEYTVSAPFTVRGLPSPYSLPPDERIAFDVLFSPTDAGVVTGNLSLKSDAVNSPTVVALSGTGTTTQLQPQPAKVTFEPQRVGTTGHRPALFSNTGTAPITLQAALLPEGFSLSGLTLPHVLAPGEVLNFQVGFLPTAASAYAGSLLLQHDASATPLALALEGTGVVATVALAPATVPFGNQRLRTTSASQTVELSNTGNAPLRISRVSVAPPFAVSGLNTPLTVAAGQKVGFQVSFAPTELGAAQQMLVLTTDAPGSPLLMPLSGNGVASHLELQPGALAFGEERVGTTSAPRTVSVVNTGTAAQGVLRVESTNAAFVVDSAGLSAPIPPGEGAPFTVAFRPGSDGPVSGEVRVFLQGTDTTPLVLSVEGSGRAVGVEGGGCSASGGAVGGVLGLLVLGVLWARRRTASR